MSIMQYNGKEYSPSQLLEIASVPVDHGQPRVSIGTALEQLDSVANMGGEFTGGCDGLDALTYHLGGPTCRKGIEALQKVLKRFEEMEGKKQPEVPDEHPYAWMEAAIDTVDANIFSGDGGGAEGVAYLQEKCERWMRGLKERAEFFAEVDEDE